jgi:Spy/CpxP family protein refolding chaperone
MKKLFQFGLAVVLSAALLGLGALAQRRANPVQPGARKRQPQIARPQRPFPRNRQGIPRGAKKNQIPTGPGQREKIQRQLMQAIGLTDQQRLRMDDIRRNNEDSIIAAGRRFRQARNALDRAILLEEYNEQRINERIEELASAQADLIRQQARVRVQLRGVLTDEQVRQLRELEQEWKLNQRELREQRLKESKVVESPDGARTDRNAHIIFELDSEFEEEDFVIWLLFG